MKISARNQIKGTVKTVKEGAVNVGRHHQGDRRHGRCRLAILPPVRVARDDLRASNPCGLVLFCC